MKGGECLAWIEGSRLSHLSMRKLKTKYKTNVQTSCESNVRSNCK